MATTEQLREQREQATMSRLHDAISALIEEHEWSVTEVVDEVRRVLENSND